jgi:RNA polymerase sigma-70 factor, ECF subfamily
VTNRPATANDEELLRLIQAGDEDAFGALYQRRQAGIYRFALRMSGSEGVAEDVTQEVFMTLLREAGNYDVARGSLASYLFGVARHQVLRRLERDRPLVPILEDAEEGEGFSPESLIIEPDPLADLARQEMIGAVRQAVLALPPHYREVVVLCDLQEMSYADCALALGCAVGTVRSRLHRARLLLLDKLRTAEFADEARPRADQARCMV